MLRSAIWTIAGCMLVAAFAVPGSAQTEPGPATSTIAGVYTDAQARRGEEQYFALCVSCHPPGTMHSEPTFSTRWAGRPLSDLFDVIKDTMPKNDPGTLTPEESAQLVAYLLKMNGMPVGKTDMPIDAETLKKIRIETRAKQNGKEGTISRSP
jgi:mono/diheme cytochrome c family protein